MDKKRSPLLLRVIVYFLMSCSILNRERSITGNIQLKSVDIVYADVRAAKYHGGYHTKSKFLIDMCVIS